MTSRPLSILATGGVELAPDAGFAPTSLKPLMEETLGGPVRRVGRFIQLAMVGAARCVGDRSLAADTAVVLCSGSGDMDVTIEVLEQIFRLNGAPKPLSFINTVSNAACFYLCRRLGLSGPAAFVARRTFAYQAALAHALTQAQILGADLQLLGGVDVLSQPEEMHRLRIGAPAGADLAESSHWLLLSTGSEAPALGRLRDARFFCDLADALSWLEDLAIDGPRLLALSDSFDAAEREALLGRARAAAYVPSRPPLGYSETAAGALYRDFLERDGLAGSALIHADRDALGVVAITAFEKA